MYFFGEVNFCNKKIVFYFVVYNKGKSDTRGLEKQKNLKAPLNPVIPLIPECHPIWANLGLGPIGWRCSSCPQTHNAHGRRLKAQGLFMLGQLSPCFIGPCHGCPITPSGFTCL